MNAVHDTIRLLHLHAPLTDIHVHPSLKAYLWSRNLWRHYHCGSTFNPFSSRSDFSCLEEGGFGVIWAAHHLVERQIFRDIPLLHLAFMFPIYWKLTTGSLMRRLGEMMDKMEKEIKRKPERTELALSAAEVKRISAAGKIAIVHTVEGGHVLEGKLENLDKLAQHGNYRDAWLYTAAALQQEIELDSTALRQQSVTALLARDTIKAAFAQKWFSPAVNRHGSSVNSVAFSPDGTTLASGSQGTTISLWDVGSGESIRELNGHSSSVLSVAFSPDGKTLASGSDDETIYGMWAAERISGNCAAILLGSVSSVAFSPDSKTLASGSRDNTIRLWDVSAAFNPRVGSGESIREWELWSAVLSVAFSPDGKTLASGYPNDTIRLWDVGSGKSLRVLSGHSFHVNSVAFSSDGETLASGSGDNTIRLWDVNLWSSYSYFEFLKNSKPTQLFFAFAEGTEFFWQVKREGLEFKRNVTPTLYPQDGYYFKYDPKFRPLLNPPKPGQSKFDQILEWARQQVKE